MRYLISILLIISTSLTIAQEDSATLLMKVEGFSHPESVIQDTVRNVLYISNIGDKNEGDGFISRVGVDGKIKDLKWITGLDDPKGLLLHGDHLWVTDNTDLVKMDPETATILERIPVEDASFLNDIAVADDGTVFISDTGKSSIYKMEISGEINEMMKTEELEFPNGLLVVGDHLYIAAWGGSGAGNVLRVDLNSESVEKVTDEGIGNLDGIQLINNNEFYISDWATGKIYRINAKGETQEKLTSEKSAGDILFLQEENQLVLPMNHQNELWWYQLN